MPLDHQAGPYRIGLRGHAAALPAPRKTIPPQGLQRAHQAGIGSSGAARLARCFCHPDSPLGGVAPLEASSGRIARHRLSGTAIDSSTAQHSIASSRMRCHDETKAYGNSR